MPQNATALQRGGGVGKLRSYVRQYCKGVCVLAIRGRTCDSTAKGYVRNKSCLNEEKEKHWNQTCNTF